MSGPKAIYMENTKERDNKNQSIEINDSTAWEEGILLRKLTNLITFK